MLHRDINSVTVRGLTGELIVTVDDEADGVTAEVNDGSLLHELTFVDGTHLCMRPKRLRPSADGSISLVVPPGMTVTMVNCHGKIVRPDGEVHELDGGTVAWTAA